MLATIVGVGTASALFVDYLADRARMRAAAAPSQPVVVKPEKKEPVVAAAKPKPVVEEPKPSQAPATIASELSSWSALTPVAKPATDAAATATVDGDVASADEAAAALEALQGEAEEVMEDDEPIGANAYAAEEPKADAGTHTAAINDESVPVPAARPARPPAPQTAAVEPDGAGESGGRAARTARAVSMRSGPQKGSNVIGTIPGDAEIRLFGCQSWCEVTYKGKRGFIYKTFVEG